MEDDILTHRLTFSQGPVSQAVVGETLFATVAANEILLFGGWGGLSKYGPWTILSAIISYQIYNPPIPPILRFYVGYIFLMICTNGGFCAHPLQYLLHRHPLSPPFSLSHTVFCSHNHTVITHAVITHCLAHSVALMED